VDQVARDLGLSPRSLQRQLEKEGATFAGLLQDLREELADAYVARSDRPITAIAGLLGYASPSAFTRWFNASFGMPPQEWRARALSREGGSVQ
jgi:AraC-like DNA-binding protein